MKNNAKHTFIAIFKDAIPLYWLPNKLNLIRRQIYDFKYTCVQCCVRRNKCIYTFISFILWSRLHKRWWNK
jgi:hypothetical protein